MLPALLSNCSILKASHKALVGTTKNVAIANQIQNLRFRLGSFSFDVRLVTNKSRYNSVLARGRYYSSSHNPSDEDASKKPDGTKASTGAKQTDKATENILWPYSKPPPPDFAAWLHKIYDNGVEANPENTATNNEIEAKEEEKNELTPSETSSAPTDLPQPLSEPTTAIVQPPLPLAPKDRKKSKKWERSPATVKGGFRAFLNQMEFQGEEAEILDRLKANITNVLSTICFKSPEAPPIWQWPPSLSVLEYLKLEKAFSRVLDPAIELKLHVASYANLASPPGVPLGSQDQHSLHSKVGFAVSGPQNHEGYMYTSIQRLAQSKNATLIDFNFSLLRSSASNFLHSAAVSIPSEDKRQKILKLYNDMQKQDDDFLLMVDGLFEVLQKDSQEKITANPTNQPRYIILLRDMESLQYFPLYHFKERLFTLKVPVCFIDMRTRATNSNKSSGLSLPQFLLPGNLGAVRIFGLPKSQITSVTTSSFADFDEEDESDDVAFKSRDGSPTRSHAFIEHNLLSNLLGDDVVDMTSKLLPETPKEETHGGADELMHLIKGKRNNLLGYEDDGSSNSDANNSKITLLNQALETLRRKFNLMNNLQWFAAAVRSSNLALVPNGYTSRPYDGPTTCLTELWLNGGNVSDLSFDLLKSRMTSSMLDDSTLASLELTFLLLSCNESVFDYSIIKNAVKMQDIELFSQNKAWRFVSEAVSSNVTTATPLTNQQPSSDNEIVDIPSETTNLPVTSLSVGTPKKALEIRFLHAALNLFHRTCANSAEIFPGKSRFTAPFGIHVADDEMLLPLAQKAYERYLKSAVSPAVSVAEVLQYQEALSKLTTELPPLPLENEKLFDEADSPQEKRKRLEETLSAHEKHIFPGFISPSDISVTFGDIGALDSAKEELMSLLIPAQFPIFREHNRLIKAPLGILLYGPPGTGKTMLCKALAKAAGINFLHISSSTVVSKWFGEAEQNAAAVFTLAKKLSPCIIFLDEADGLLASRSNAEHEAARKMKNEFLSGWDGLLSGSGDTFVTLVAATNRPYDLDTASLRRLPHRVLVPLPDKAARIDILTKTLKGVPIAPESVDINNPISEDTRRQIVEEVAALTDGYSGSDLSSICTRASLQHIRNFMKDIEFKGELLVEGKSLFHDTRQTPNSAHVQTAMDLAMKHAHKPVTIAEFKVAISEISASVNSRSFSEQELKKWHQSFGSKVGGQTMQKVPLGF